jgi:acyl-CoA thioesterase-1
MAAARARGGMAAVRLTTHTIRLTPIRCAALLVMAALFAGCGQQSASGRATGTGGKQVLVGIGASDAVGIGATDPDRDNWVAQLGARLPSGSRVVNLGISGADSTLAVQQELPVALDIAPTIAVVWLGVNDFSEGMTLPSYTDSLATLLRDLRDNGRTRVFVGNLPDLRLLPAFKDRDPASLQAAVTQWNAAIAQVTQSAGADLVDINANWSELRDHPEYISGDGLHPTSAGYRRLADLFWQAIMRRQPSALSYQPSAVSRQLSAISSQPLGTASFQRSAAGGRTRRSAPAVGAG